MSLRPYANGQVYRPIAVSQTAPSTPGPPADKSSVAPEQERPTRETIPPAPVEIIDNAGGGKYLTAIGQEKESSAPRPKGLGEVSESLPVATIAGTTTTRATENPRNTKVGEQR
ncbi:hypothetical protein GQ55_5G357300 [Panicum hallii var. hallii]|uniref:Uncharacterized protein n=1 Tax=Panicum hallii var. hallii TaxID=1504633 RepID=A0A2T7DMB6_9POAL|nr:hypothetical protein GQ55_5G357300 [Panicum hallii var. hallii]